MKNGTSDRIFDGVIQRLMQYVCIGLCCVPTLSLADDVKVNQLKTAYVYHLTKYIQWSPSHFADSEHFAICSIGQDGLVDNLTQLQGRSVGTKDISIQPLESWGELRGSNCQILVVGASKETEFQANLELIRQHGTLSVSSIENFAVKGGMMSFTRVGNRVRMMVNKQRVEQMELKASASLLEVCHIVSDSSLNRILSLHSYLLASRLN